MAPALIPFNDLRRQWDATRVDMTTAFEAVGASGWYILGREVREFEAELARLWGHTHAVGVASGLDSIEIALRIAGCQPGAKVLTTSNSAFATTLAIMRIGAVPVFADVDDFGLVDLDACGSILAGDPEIRFFVPVHMYGHSLDLARLRVLKDRHRLIVVEDCAQSIGAKWRGERAGTVGQLAATSFYPTKNLGGLGDGGAILTSVPEYAEEARKYRDYGQSAKYRHETEGGNSRLDELQAALLRRVGLARLGDWTARRRALAAQYLAGIANPGIVVPGAPAGSESVWHLFPVVVDPRSKADFLSHLKANGIEAAEHFPVALPDQPVMSSVRYEAPGKLLNVRRFCASEVSLPLHPFLTDAECGRVADACNRWIKES